MQRRPYRQNSTIYTVAHAKKPFFNSVKYHIASGVAASWAETSTLCSTAAIDLLSSAAVEQNSEEHSVTGQGQKAKPVNDMQVCTQSIQARHGAEGGRSGGLRGLFLSHYGCSWERRACPKASAGAFCLGQAPPGRPLALSQGGSHIQHQPGFCRVLAFRASKVWASTQSVQCVKALHWTIPSLLCTVVSTWRKMRAFFYMPVWPAEFMQQCGG